MVGDVVKVGLDELIVYEQLPKGLKLAIYQYDEKDIKVYKILPDLFSFDLRMKTLENVEQFVISGIYIYKTDIETFLKTFQNKIDENETFIYWNGSYKEIRATDFPEYLF